MTLPPVLYWSPSLAEHLNAAAGDEHSQHGLIDATVATVPLAWSADGDGWAIIRELPADAVWLTAAHRDAPSQPADVEVGALARHLRNLMNGGVADSEHIARSFLGYLGVVGMRQELAYLRSRVAELDAGQVRVEWGVRYREDDVDDYYEDEEAARVVAADPTDSGVAVRREIRTGPWTDAPEATP